MKVWGEIEHGDTFQAGDEMIRQFKSTWDKIPETWIGNKLNREDDITINRQGYKFRRPLTEVWNKLNKEK